MLLLVRKLLDAIKTSVVLEVFDSLAKVFVIQEDLLDWENSCQIHYSFIEERIDWGKVRHPKLSEVWRKGDSGEGRAVVRGDLGL